MLPDVALESVFLFLGAVNTIKSTVQFLSLKIRHAEFFRQKLFLPFYFPPPVNLSLYFNIFSSPPFTLPLLLFFCLDSCLPNHFMMLLLSDLYFFHYPSTKEKKILLVNQQ